MPTEPRRLGETYGWSRAGEEWSKAWGTADMQWYGSILPRISAFVPDGEVPPVDASAPNAHNLHFTPRRIVDQHVLRLIRLWLKAPVEEPDGDGTRRMTGGKGSSCGTPPRPGWSARCSPTCT